MGMNRVKSAIDTDFRIVIRDSAGPGKGRCGLHSPADERKTQKTGGMSPLFSSVREKKEAFF